MVRGLGNSRYLITDHQGSVIAENGASTARYSHGPYGEPNTWTGSRFRYTGQIVLPEVNLFHYKARVYDPILGRFLQTDPVGYEDDLNLYAYVGNDPLNQLDPLGMERWPIEEEQPIYDNYDDAARSAVLLGESIADEVRQQPERDGPFEVTISIQERVNEEGESHFQAVLAYVSPAGEDDASEHGLLPDGSIAGTVHPHDPDSAGTRGISAQDYANRGPSARDRDIVVPAGRDRRPDRVFHLTIRGPDGALRDFRNGRGRGREIDPPGTYDVRRP